MLHKGTICDAYLIKKRKMGTSNKNLDEPLPTDWKSSPPWNQIHLLCQKCCKIPKKGHANCI